MPFKSTAQRKWMFLHHPKMAKRWAAHTKKGKKLPKKVGEGSEDERTGHDGFEVLDYDPSKLKEMPHIDADMDVHGKHVTVVDLRVERYPVSKEEKQRLLRAFQKTGVVGEMDGELFHFKPDYTIEVIEPSAAEKLPRLPRGWDKMMVSEAHIGNRYISDEDDPMLGSEAICGDDEQEVPTMIKVFLTKEK